MGATKWLQVKLLSESSTIFGNIDKNCQFHCRVPLTGVLVFLTMWLLLLICFVAFCIILLRTVMYFLGMCFYVSAMVDDLQAALYNHNGRLGDRSNKKIELLPITEIEFHNVIIEYVPWLH